MAVLYTQNVVPSTVIPAPNVTTYATRSLYVTPSEFKAAPTGVDVSQLIPGDNNPAHQAAALVMQLQRASGVADKICRKVLGATLDTKAGSFRIQNDPALGPVIKVPLDFIPIIGVTGVSIGSTPASMAPVTDLSNVWISLKTATIPLGNTIGASARGPKQFATVQYINGWVNTTLTAGAVAGAVSITVASTLGIMAGQQLNLTNTSNAEMVTVDPSYIPSNTLTNALVPLTAPIVGTYAAGDTVTNMPQEIKQAVILIAKSLILTRGSDAVEISSVNGQPNHVSSEPGSISSDMDMAEFLLADYVRAA